MKIYCMHVSQAVSALSIYDLYGKFYTDFCFIQCSQPFFGCNYCMVHCNIEVLFLVFACRYLFPKQLLTWHFWSLEQRVDFSVEAQKRKVLLVSDVT